MGICCRWAEVKLVEYYCRRLLNQLLVSGWNVKEEDARIIGVSESVLLCSHCLSFWSTLFYCALMWIGTRAGRLNGGMYSV